MRLLLVRHGNTFESGEPVLRVGCKTDLPLTSKGRDQAFECAEAIVRSGLNITRMISGPLKRHRTHSGIIAEHIGFDPDEVEYDDRLQEIDYGAWEGKTDDEIRSMGFTKALEDYNTLGIWPNEGIWGESRIDFEGRIKQLFLELSSQDNDQVVLLITSGGVLRVLHEIAFSGEAAVAHGRSKVATGGLSSISISNDTAVIDFWNHDPVSAFPA